MGKPERREALTPTFPGRSFRVRPHGMSRVEGATPDQIAAIQSIALGVYTDMSNAGFSLRETLAAIYISGAKHALELSGVGVGGSGASLPGTASGDVIQDG